MLKWILMTVLIVGSLFGATTVFAQDDSDDDGQDTETVTEDGTVILDVDDEGEPRDVTTMEDLEDTQRESMALVWVVLIVMTMIGLGVFVALLNSEKLKTLRKQVKKDDDTKRIDDARRK